MRFDNPYILHWLWLLPLLAGLFFFALKRREKISARFIEGHLLDQEEGKYSRGRHQLKSILLLLVYAFSIIALARPQWGYELQTVKRQGVDILVAIDVSKSMLTQDVRPSRLERTKFGVKDIVKKLQGDRIGLIAFAGQAFLMCPLTTDYNGFLMTLDDLSIDSIPRGGTDLGKAIEEAVKDYGDAKQIYKAVILITDGEEGEGSALAAAKKAKDKGIKIYTVGIGTKEGDLVRVVENGQSTFLKDADGNFIKSRLNENLLQQIAYNTGGAYVRAGGGQFGVDYLYDQYISKLEKRDIEEKEDKKYHERFQWPLGIAFLILCIEALLTTARQRRHV